MVGTKEKLDRKGNVIMWDSDDLYWAEKSYYDSLDNPTAEVDWKWEAKDKANDELFFKFIDEHDYWEMFKESIINYYADPFPFEEFDDKEVLRYLLKEGVVATAKEYDLHDFYMWFICDDEDMAEEYVEWLN